MGTPKDKGYDGRIALRLLGICEDVKMNSEERVCEDEKWMELAEDCRPLYDRLWH
jgi:hypothetical protein